MSLDDAPNLLDDADPRLPAHVLARLALAPAVAQENAREAEVRLSRHRLAHNKALRALRARGGPLRRRLRMLRELTDSLARCIAPSAACRKGCTHCCHIPVALSQAEALLIGDAIGREPVRFAWDRAPEPSQEYGYHRPCPFLREGACSIYAERPFACRAHFNLDADDLLCRLILEATVPVPLADMTALQVVYAELCAGEPMADIRDFFAPDG